ncbi:hypothetical protein DM02DRAFT_596157 [Periconia macrospinosa]|uniref:Zn(2)-C6 fungal-type domain-containing protein n=1 Tax=Periconia macrospinosa TaxID=97972 RepID=A0A2V1DL16_9PLEO|nr:hypothetical protein DM02DRAFT_596157 [Periconia macrospinosa]
MMELEIVPRPAPVQTNPKTSESKAPSSNSVPVAVTRWKSRRRGACGMCKLKKVRCDGGTPCMNCRRNNQECEYTLAKKHQASKKSVRSAPRIFAPRFWKKANGTSSSITAAAAEVPNNGQPSPALTIPFQGSPVNSNDTVPTHAQSSTSDSHSAQSLLDAYSNDTNWNFDFDLERILLPPGDARNVLDFPKFSWPVLAPNDDGNLDLDVPVTADGLDTANYETPVTTLHNEYPPYLRSLSHSLHSTEGPGDWVKMVDINDKVRSSSWDELGPAGDLCSNHDPKVSNNTEQDDVQRIFSSISPVNNQQTPMNTNEEHHRTFASWYWNDTALMERCVNVCFEQPLGVPNFLTRSLFQKYVKEARGRPQGDIVLISLIDSVMAFGFHAFWKRSRRFSSPSERKEADCYSRIALSSHSSVLHSPDTLTIISEQINEAAHWEILTGAINCARALKLENGDIINRNYKSCDERDLAKRALWFLYSIEVPHSLRNGISPSLDRDWIDFAPPRASTGTDWFRIQCLYALVIGSAASLLYSQRGLRLSAAEREHKLDISFKLLEDWRSHLPPALREIHKADIQGIMADYQVHHIALCMFRQYHEAIFLIYFPWTGKQSEGRIAEKARRKSLEMCVNSAQVVLTTANQVSSLEILDRYEHTHMD